MELLKKIFLENLWNLTDKMKKIVVAVLFVLALVSCQNKDKHFQKVIHCYAETDIPWVTYIYEINGTDTIWVEEKWYHENGVLQLEGNIVDNQREGEFRGYYPSGELMSVGTFINGKREGKGKIYFESGKINIINNYCNGKPCGIWEFFDEEGNLVDVKEY